MRTVRFVVLVALLACPAVAHANPITYSGYLDNPATLAPAGGTLISYQGGAADLTTFPDQNVALFTFTVAVPTTFTVTSRGYNDLFGNTPNVDGFDAYVAIFSGIGPAASFVDEFFNPIVAGDFQATTGVLAAGSYTLAISMWNNYACAAGGCFPITGTLGDGFSGLSQFDVSRALYFEVDLDTGSTPVPEPGTLTLLLVGGAALAQGCRRRTSR